MHRATGGGGRPANAPQASARAESECQECPRCHSTNTKFCYYNNYNLTQPRHFCKSCRRYWTVGGTLRNIPVGGCNRKSSGRVLKPKTPDGPETERQLVVSEHEFPVMGSSLHTEIPTDGLLDDAGTFGSMSFPGGCFGEPFDVLGWPSGGGTSSRMPVFGDGVIGNSDEEEIWHGLGSGGLDDECWGGGEITDSVIPAPRKGFR